MERRYQVFVSSTYTDLVDERREVIQALLELDCMPAGMEMFPAANDDQWTLIRRVIDDSDYYLVVVGGRYGSISDSGLSYTEREFDYAVESGKPVIGFVHASPGDLPGKALEMDRAAQEKLSAFRDKVMKRLVKTYTTPHELGSVVSRSVVRLMKDHPAEGWVRARFAQTPESLQETSALRAQVAELELANARVASESPVPLDELQQGNDLVEVFFTIASSQSWRDKRVIEGSLTYTWNEVFQMVGPSMLDEAGEVTLRNRIQARLLADVLNLDDPPTILEPSVKLSNDEFDRIKIQLRALQLIEKGDKKRPIADKITYWKLTIKGDQLLVGLLAARRTGGTGSGLDRARSSD